MAVIWFTAVGSFFIFRDFRQRFTKNRSPPIEHKGKGNLMKTIKYEVNGTFVEVEVSDEFARQYEKIEAEEARQIWRDKKRKDSSLERMVEAGFQVADPNSNVEEKLFEKYDIEQLSKAIKTLTEDQKWLIKQIFYYGRKQSEVAAELSICKQALNNRIARILEKIKKFLN